MTLRRLRGGVSHGGSLAEVKALFFDTALVQRRLDKAAVTLLRRVGAKTRLRARGKIRNAPKKRRSTGSRPPYNRTGLLKRFILFSLDPDADSVVVGPVKLAKPGKDSVPELLEYGGVSSANRSGRNVAYDAFPYMTPSFEEVLRDVPQMAKDLLQ